MTNTDLVKGIWIVEAKVGNDQFCVEKVVDHMNIDKARSCVLVGPLDMESGEISQNRFNDPLKQPIGMNTKLAPFVTDGADNKTKLLSMWVRHMSRRVRRTYIA